MTYFPSRHHQDRQEWDGNGFLSIVEQLEVNNKVGQDRSAILAEPGDSVTSRLIVSAKVSNVQ